MSFEELYSKLQDRLEKRGILNDLKAEMRGKLIKELYDVSPNFVNRKPFDGEEITKLPVQVSNWLLCDHLQRGHYEFTLSTFLRESQLEKLPEKTMTLNDVFYILGIDSNSEVEKELIDLYRKKKSTGSLLYFIIQYLIGSKNSFSAKHVSTAFKSVQTDIPKRDSVFESEIHKKMLNEVEYLRGRLSEESNLNVKLISQLTEIEQKTGLKSDKISQKEFENSTVSPNEDKETIEKIDRNSPINTATSQEDSKMNTKLSKDVVETKAKLAEALDLIDFQTTVAENVQMKLKETESSLRILQEQQLILQNENESLQSCLSTMSNYGVIKSELIVTKKELEQAINHYEKAQESWLKVKEKYESKLSDLTIKLSTPCIELLQTHKDLQKIHDAFYLEQSVWNDQKAESHRKLKDSKFLHEKALLRNADLVQQIDHLNEIIHRLRLEIENTRQANIYRATYPYPSGSQYQMQLARTPDPFQYKYTFKDEQFKKPEIHNSSTSSNTTTSEKSPLISSKPPNFIIEAKTRIDQLQAEADSIEKKYSQCLDNHSKSIMTSCLPYMTESKKQFDSIQDYHDSTMQRKTEFLERLYQSSSSSGKSSTLYGDVKPTVRFDMSPVNILELSNKYNFSSDRGDFKYSNKELEIGKKDEIGLTEMASTSFKIKLTADKQNEEIITYQNENRETINREKSEQSSLIARSETDYNLEFKPSSEKLFRRARELVDSMPLSVRNETDLKFDSIEPGDTNKLEGKLHDKLPSVIESSQLKYVAKYNESLLSRNKNPETENLEMTKPEEEKGVDSLGPVNLDLVFKKGEKENTGTSDIPSQIVKETDVTVVKMDSFKPREFSTPFVSNPIRNEERKLSSDESQTTESDIQLSIGNQNQQSENSNSW